MTEHVGGTVEGLRSAWGVVSAALRAEAVTMEAGVDAMPRLPDGLMDAVGLGDPASMIRAKAQILYAAAAAADRAEHVDMFFAELGEHRAPVASALRSRAALARWDAVVRGAPSGIADSLDHLARMIAPP